MKIKKIVLLGGGTGASTILKGLKYFPVDITAVITVSDNGRSTGRLRKEFSTPAVGDIRHVLSNLSTLPDEVRNIMEYRMSTYSDLNGHALGNLILTSLYQKTGSLKTSIEYLSKLLQVKHTVILSMGSLYTSLMPHLICKDVVNAINNSKARVMYVCNAMTQPGETDGFGVSDHVNAIEKYLGKDSINAVIVSNTVLPKKILEKYAREEEKDFVKIDYENIKKGKYEILEDDLLTTQDGTIKHDSLKLSSIIFSYLMR